MIEKQELFNTVCVDLYDRNKRLEKLLQDVSLYLGELKDAEKTDSLNSNILDRLPHYVEEITNSLSV